MTLGTALHVCSKNSSWPQDPRSLVVELVDVKPVQSRGGSDQVNTGVRQERQVVCQSHLVGNLGLDVSHRESSSGLVQLGLTLIDSNYMVEQLAQWQGALTRTAPHVDGRHPRSGSVTLGQVVEDRGEDLLGVAWTIFDIQLGVTFVFVAPRHLEIMVVSTADWCSQ
jgi:hypothetical protein